MFCNAGDEVKVPEERRTIFLVPKINYGKFEREMEKLSKKSQKAGGWEIMPVVIGSKKDAKDRTVYEVFLDAPDVRLGGYRFIARLDHAPETGNIVRALANTGVEVPVKYRDAAPDCDHCKMKRMRRDTFVIQNDETGDFLQVGSTCLEDFFGTDPKTIARLAEIMGYAREAAEGAANGEPEQRPQNLRDLRHVPLEDYLLHCSAIMRADGGYKRADHGDYSTKVRALFSLFGWDNQSMIEDQDRANVCEALEWITTLASKRNAGDNLNSYEHNVLVVGESVYIEGRSAGIAASIMGCYKRNMTPKVAPIAYVKPEPINLGDMSAVIMLFNTAGSKLKYPKISISMPEIGTVIMSVAGPSSANPGSINIATPGGYGNNTWFGRITRDGEYQPSRAAPAALEAGLRAFAADPAGEASRHGNLTGNCCFCTLPLTDPRSVKVGYGKTCAKHYSLPY